MLLTFCKSSVDEVVCNKIVVNDIKIIIFSTRIKSIRQSVPKRYPKKIIPKNNGLKFKIAEKKCFNKSIRKRKISINTSSGGVSRY